MDPNSFSEDSHVISLSSLNLTVNLKFAKFEHKFSTPLKNGCIPITSFVTLTLLHRLISTQWSCMLIAWMRKFFTNRSCLMDKPNLVNLEFSPSKLGWDLRYLRIIVKHLIMKHMHMIIIFFIFLLAISLKNIP
jgi:hypothetical protein